MITSVRIKKRKFGFILFPIILMGAIFAMPNDTSAFRVAVYPESGD